MTVELGLCQRYFNKSYDMSVIPGDTTSGISNFLGGCMSAYSPDANCFWTVYFPVNMRAHPVLTPFAPNTGTANKCNIGGSLTNYSVFTGSANTCLGTVLCQGNGLAGGFWYYVHYTANAEL